MTLCRRCVSLLQDTTAASYTDTVSAVRTYVGAQTGRAAAQVAVLNMIPGPQNGATAVLALNAPEGDNWMSATANAGPTSIGAGVLVTSMVLGGVVPQCGNDLCEAGERCAQGSTSSFCCARDCTAPTVGTLMTICLMLVGYGTSLSPFARLCHLSLICTFVESLRCVSACISRVCVRALYYAACPLYGGLPCGGNGVCLSTKDGTSMCDCFSFMGYTGADCSACAPGYGTAVIVLSSFIAGLPMRAS
jgi:hypothetical protein